MVRFLVQCCLLIAVAVFAFRRGGWPEKVAASALIAHMVIDQAYHAIFGTYGGDYQGIHFWHFALDCTLFAVLVALALRADRWWTLWLGSIQLLAVIGHLLRAIDADMPPLIYAILERYPFWMLILATGCGTFNAQRRSKLARTNT